MQKVDRLGWAAGIAFKSYGLKLGVRTNDPTVLERIQDCLPPGWRQVKSPLVQFLFSLRIGGADAKRRIRNYSLLYGDILLRARTMDLDELFDALEGEIQMVVSEWAQNRIFVHAGVVGWKGRAIVIPGRSFSGKSTLVAELVRAGATYYSDEYAVLDARGRVHPYARRLSLRRGGGQLPRRCSAEELGSQTGSAPLPVGLVAVTRFSPGARWNPQPVSAGRAVLELINHTIPARAKPDAVLQTLEQLAPRARVVKGMRGEARETAEALLAEAGR